MQLPSNPFMLMSFINMKLRDFYENLDALCSDLGINKEELCKRLEQAGFEYSEENKKFW